MDNEGLLAWSEHEVKRARILLDMAEAETAIRREIVRIEKENKMRMTDCEAYLKKLGVPVIVYGMASSLEELESMIADKKEFLRRCGVGEEELEP